MIYIILFYLLGALINWFLIAWIDDNGYFGERLSANGCFVALIISWLGTIIVIIMLSISFISKIKFPKFLFQPSFKYFKRKNS